MTAPHEDVAPLLGAWAVGACSEDEARRVLEHLAECPTCTDETRRLTASTALGQAPGALPDLSHAAFGGSSAAEVGPPGGLRGRVLEAARGRRSPAPAAPEYAAPYAAQVSVLDALLAELTGQDWATNVIDDWSVQDVVAHLGATDRLVVEQVGVEQVGIERLGAEQVGIEPVGAERHGERRLETIGDDADVDARTAEAIAFERGRRPEETRARWRDQARALSARLAVLEAEPGTASALREMQPAIGDGPGPRIRIRLPMRRDTAVIARAFETWVHTADIAAAVGRSLPSPLPRHLHTIADLGVRSLPLAMALRGMRHEGPARVVLEGPGGGDWLVPLGGDGAAAAPLVTITLDVLEFCMLAADRRNPAGVEVAIGGDTALGRRLLESAPAFAGP